MSEWRPIETAPKDGTLILVWPDGGSYPEVVWWAAYPPPFEKDSGWCTGNVDSYGDPEPRVCATHWMPLPEAP